MMNFLLQLSKWIKWTGLFVAIAIGIYFHSWLAGLLYFGITLTFVGLLERYRYKKFLRGLSDSLKEKNISVEGEMPELSKEELFRLGNRAYSNAEFSKAFRFLYLVRKNNNYCSANNYRIMAECLLEEEDFKLAENVLSEGISMYPDNSHLYYMRGMTRGTLNNLDGKIEDLTTALKKYNDKDDNRIYKYNAQWYDSDDKLYLNSLRVAELLKKKRTNI